MTRLRWYGPTLLLLITALLVVMLGPGLARQIAHAQTAERIQLVQNSIAEAQNPTLAQLNEAFARVSEVVEPSVVHINVKSRRSPASSGRLPFNLPGFPGMPGQPERQPDGPDPRGELDQYNPAIPFGNGSGWVYDDQGHIITNNHVIDGADEIEVLFFDGSVRTATVVGTDPNTDVAVLKVEGDDLHPATIARADVRQGEIVFAFGSPLRFKFSMSQGIVSAKNRKLNIIGPTGYEQFIQTDAAINPGNSGGPLTNIHGEVVGMNTAIASTRGAMGGAGFMGLGFAIPVDMAVAVVDQLIEHGEVSRGFLGIEIKELPPTLARTYGYDGRGVLIVNPLPGSPADEAGLRSEDIVIAINGEPVADPDDLRYLVGAMRPGEEIEVTIFRNGEEMTRTVTLDEMPRDLTARRMPRPDEQSTDTGEVETSGMELLEKFGIEKISPFTEAEAQRLGVLHEEGVLVEEVRRGSIAQMNGFAPGTIITKVMNTEVGTVEALSKAVAEVGEDAPIRFRILQFDRRSRELVPNIVAMQID